jgi:hypothetical protein
MGFAATQSTHADPLLATLVAQTDQLEPGLAALEVVTLAEASNVGLIRVATANLLAVLSAFESATLTSLNLIQADTSSQLNTVGQIYELVKPLVFLQSTSRQCSDHLPGSAFSIAQNSIRRGLKIINASGEPDNSTNPINGECWIFGSYRDSNVSNSDFDFVIEPGQQVLVDAPSGDIWLSCLAQTQPTANFVIVEYE